MDNQTYICTIRQMYVQSDKYMDNQKNIWTIRQIYGQSDKYNRKKSARESTNNLFK